MNNYLCITGSYDSLSSKYNSLYIIEALNPDEALNLAAKNLFKKDELFIEHLKECSINTSFAEKFWLQTYEDQEYFCNHHNVLINFDEFKKRVKKYFGLHSQAAQDYITFYTLECDGHKK